MWSALMNGSGLPGGGGAAGGYVPSQGWEFVPCSRMNRADRGRGKSRSPSRRISSPPTVFSHIYESYFGGGEAGAGTPLEVLRGQMWPGPEDQQQQQQQQTQHTRLKKKFEDLKKRHIQDKEEWMQEKESLLREVADIQGGENRRILLDLKTVLEEVQTEVKKEEEKRRELQLQYTRDRCAWELEKAELKCRIAQLEAREGAGSIGGGAASGSVASRGAQEQHGETQTLRREREEQRRLLADTHSTAMDLRCRLEHNERDWLREKAELLERFDVERREWESQLRDMQRKIEELYCDVRPKREGAGVDAGGVVHRLSIRSTSSGSSLFSDNEPLSSSSVSEPVRHPPGPDSGPNRSSSGFVSRDGHHSTFTQNEHPQPEPVDQLPSRGVWRQDSVTDSGEAVDAAFGGDPGCIVPQKNVCDGDENKVRPDESPLWAELSYGSERKRNTTALNAAMKEIARVSEELCSYQDEIRKKSGDKRNQPESLCLCEESEMLLGHDKTRLEVDEAPCDLSQIYDDLRALERENWVTLTPDNTWRVDKGPSQTCRMNTADPDSYRETQTSPELSETDTAGPPIPPRTSSWNLSAPVHPDTELHIPESPVTTARRCHGPCVRVDKKCSSPSIVRKFEAMLQENEGKVLIDGVVATCSTPASSECNMGSCHNRWSCDSSKFTNSKLATYGTVQKSFSEVNILTARKDLCSDYCPAFGNLKSPELQVPQIVKELPLDLLLSSLETPPVVPSLQASRRNITLEEKTAEFNRTLFQAEMGRGVKEQDGFTVTDSCPVVSPTRASDDTLPAIMGVHPEVTLSLHTSSSTTHNPNVQPRRVECGPEGQEVRIKQEIPSDRSSEQPQMGLREAANSSAHCPEVKHKVQTASSPSRKTQLRATEALFSESVLPESSQPGQSVTASTSKNDNPHGMKPQSARVGVSLQQPSAENKQRQSDTSRPRMMNDHPWKALTLAAYPRPEGSRSNYGAVERILKSYESAARTQQTHSKPSETTSSPNVGVRQEENVTEVDMLDMDPLPLPPTLRHTQTSHTLQMHSTHGATGVKEVQLTVQESEETSVSSSIRRNFSRPARPAKRRLPSRWASRSPTSSSSPSTPPAAPPSFPRHKHSTSFTYSHAFHIETVII